MTENYIVINGKRAELTAEQLKQLGIWREIEYSNPFKKAETGEYYYYITCKGEVKNFYKYNQCSTILVREGRLHNVANYCTNYSLMEQRALHETLYRLLWRYSMTHEGDKISLNHCWGIQHSKGVYEAHETYGHAVGRCAFYSKETAQNAIEEIIKPFMAANPNFKW